MLHGTNWDSTQSPVLRGWERLLDCSVAWDTLGIPGTPHSPWDSGDGKDCGTVVLLHGTHCSCVEKGEDPGAGAPPCFQGRTQGMFKGV